MSCSSAHTHESHDVVVQGSSGCPDLERGRLLKRLLLTFMKKIVHCCITVYTVYDLSSTRVGYAKAVGVRTRSLPATAIWPIQFSKLTALLKALRSQLKVFISWWPTDVLLLGYLYRWSSSKLIQSYHQLINRV
jgi:hypothetical protein